jgi:acyl carrier protein
MILTSTEGRVLQLAQENFGNVTLDAKVHELGDSLELASMVLELENEFGIDIPDSELPKLTTLHDVVKYVERYG